MKTISINPIKLKIELENAPLPIWRKVLMPNNINMMQLHLVIQIAMGWEFAHLFSFGNKKYQTDVLVGLPDPEENGFFSRGPKVQPAERVLLQHTFADEFERKPFWYLYDFGDDWWHRITFLKPTKKDLDVWQGVPFCLDAWGACPPEDCGGVWGYTDFLTSIMDKKHPGYREMMEWNGLKKGEKYDPETVDIESVNQVLQELDKSKEWRLTAENYFNA